jgi:hypothetical protein
MPDPKKHKADSIDIRSNIYLKAIMVPPVYRNIYLITKKIQAKLQLFKI